MDDAGERDVRMAMASVRSNLAEIEPRSFCRWGRLGDLRMRNLVMKSAHPACMHRRMHEITCEISSSYIDIGVHPRRPMPAKCEWPGGLVHRFHETCVGRVLFNPP